MRKLLFILVIVSAFAVNLSAQIPAAAQTAFERGAQAANLKEYEKALEHFQNADRLSGNEPANSGFPARIHFNIGVCLFHLGRFEEAAGEYVKSLELAGGNYQKAFYALGMARTELKDWDAAAAAFRKAVSLKKDDAEAWFDLALALIEMKDFKAAKTAFQNAIKYRSGAAADAYNNIGVILALEGDLDSAKDKFKIALRLSGGKSVEARNNLNFCESHTQNSNQIPAASGLSFNSNKK